MIDFLVALFLLLILPKDKKQISEKEQECEDTQMFFLEEFFNSKRNPKQ